MSPQSDFHPINITAADVHLAHLAEVERASARGFGPDINRRKWRTVLKIVATLLLAFAGLSLIF